MTHKTDNKFSAPSDPSPIDAFLSLLQLIELEGRDLTAEAVAIWHGAVLAHLIQITPNAPAAWRETLAAMHRGEEAPAGKRGDKRRAAARAAWLKFYDDNELWSDNAAEYL